ncbi:hypothetical protein TNCV_4135171 [Trichonephila clavipes]|nr:hypothetical protein TNCV_4135171 [Trichonephila clavipes]
MASSVSRFNTGRLLVVGIFEISRVPIRSIKPVGTERCDPQRSILHTSGHVALCPIEDYIANSCDHSRSNYLFVDSINRCTFLAVRCESYDSFVSGKCEENGPLWSIMGLRAQKIPELSGSRRFYLNTDDESPYCME